ncbi:MULTISPECIES: GEVED domain-containing protein [unclassified Chryseobacterium]|uniref:GEVED domain-containing protein n=1 Tax=unclassified Chryseobacterium TaxID=2593645 RepID=UPI0030101880
MKPKINFFQKHNLRLAWFVLMTLGGFTTIKSQNLLTESFNYTSGTILTTANWIQLAAGSPSATVSAGNLAYPGTIANNFGNKVSLTATGQDVYRTFTSAVLNATTPAIYTSAVVNVTAAQSTGDFFLSLGNTTTSIARLYIRSNGAGFSFGVLRTTSAGTGTVEYESTERPFNTNIRIVLKYEQVTGTTNDIVKLYVNPSTASEPGSADILHTGTLADTASFSAVQLYQGIAANAPALDIDGITVATSWSGLASAIYDYGDVPISYDNTKDGVYVPATHTLLSGLALGSIVPDLELAPSSVSSGADNNGSNGDGSDEDAITVSANQIRKGVPYTLSVPVTNPSGTKYLYGWIDFNNDGLFQAGELSDAFITFTATGSTTQTLTWSAAKTATLVTGVTKLYMRLRLSDRSLADFTTAASGGALVDERSIGNGAASTVNAADYPTVANGEVEDYQIEVVDTFDYGDAPSTYENDKDGNPLPAMHAPLSGFSIGTIWDIENAPNSIAAGADNNGTNGDGTDEDGITTLTSVSRGVAYSITVPVSIPSTLTGTKYLYGWLDLNGDGHFQLNEIASATPTSITAVSATNVTLTWSAAQTAAAASGATKIYLRLRLSNLNLLDFTTAASGGALIDERSVGNGATSATVSTNSSLIAFGEVEDYQLPVDLYDFGDAPASYEINNAGVAYPARQITTSQYTIGSVIDNEQTAQSVTAGNDNNGTNGDGIDEDGLSGALPVITKAAPFSFSVPVTAQTASSVIAWIDFNNNGKFEANEVAYTLATGTVTGYQSVAVGTSIKTFWFRGTQTNTVPNGINNLYVRIRLTQTAGTDNTATTAVDERSIADAANTGIYTTPANGEVEDYRFAVIRDLDFGDAQESYEMDKDGLGNPANFKPARNSATDALFLGMFYTLEQGPASVASGTDNNAPNGDGASDDGLSQDQLRIRTNAVNTYTVGVNNTTGAAATLYAWIDFNNNERFEGSEFATASVANNAVSANISFTAAQVNTIAASTGKVYMRLRLIQPNAEVTISDLTTGTNAAVVDERAIADGLSTGVYASASLGETEDYQLTITRDYGDVPGSYENGIPASHTNSIIPELTIGSTIDYELTNNAVAPGADNNGTNGDGADEDGIVTPQTITSGAPFTLTVPINTTVTGTKNLYAWIDINGDGIFNGNEAATVSASVTAGTTSNFTLTWNSTNASASVVSAGKTYVRLRLSGTALTNSNSANAVLIDTRSFGQGVDEGEIEDYQFLVSNLYDYGDVPASLYEYTRDAVPVYQPARQASSSTLRLGNTVDIESVPNSVAAYADNNGTNGDGTDEDGIASVMPVYKGINYYSKVSILNNTGAAKTLYGWIDINNNGRFESSELASVSMPTSASQQTATLLWTGTNTNTIPVGVTKVYMRLRVSENLSMSDFITGVPGALVDERSIGDGLSTGLYGIAYGGEVEDYLLPVITDLDYGDAAPVSYETSRTSVVAPARQASSQGLYLGNNPADYESVKEIQAGNALGDDTNGQDDEDGTVPGPIVSGGGYSLNIAATNSTSAAKTLFGWIDFNNNGSFEASEAATVSVPAGTNQGSVVLNWVTTATNIVGNPSQLYMRLRISEGTLTDFVTGAPGLLVDERALADGLITGEYAASPVIYNGEIEDYTISVTTDLDYGDVPVSYEKPGAVLIPARQISSIALQIGTTPDIEPSAQSVTADTDNNTTNGDGLDEDGIDPSAHEVIRGTAFSLPVKVTNVIGTAKVLYGWIDINNNGVFESKEVASVSVPTNTVNGTAILTWAGTNTANIAASDVYLRLRLSDGILADNTVTTAYDERAVGDGLTTGAYAVNAYRGEIEDYRLHVTFPITCSGTANIPPNGVITVNGVQVTTVSSGSVTTYGPSYSSCYGAINVNAGSLWVGSGSYGAATAASAWSVTFTFNKPVNDLILVLSATGGLGNENFIFNSNGGAVSVFSDNSCYSTITGNTINSGSAAPVEAGGGGGIFKISAPNAFTTLTINGAGGYNGTLIAMCTASITPQPPVIKYLTPDSQTVCTNAAPAAIAVSATGTGTLTYQWYSNATNSNVGGTMIAGATSESYTPPASSVPVTNYYYVIVTDSNGSRTSPPVSVVVNDCSTSYCYKPGITSGAALDSKAGITSLSRAGANDPDNWPMVRKGAWLVLESKTKGFVINRVPFDGSGNPVGIAPADFVEGMMVYDTTNNCLKVYTSIDGGINFSWQCMSTQTCPD